MPLEPAYLPPRTPIALCVVHQQTHAHQQRRQFFPRLYRQRIHPGCLCHPSKQHAARLQCNAEVYTIYGIRKAFFHNGLATDRKSTRLNSSHTVISYAVFCLKKKKKKKKRLTFDTNYTNLISSFNQASVL